MKTEQDFRTALMPFTDDKCAEFYVELNCYLWPKELEHCKPDGMEGMSHKEIYASPEFKAAWKAIDERTSEFARSKAWWVLGLKRTSEAHAEWWSSQKHSIDSPSPATHREG